MTLKNDKLNESRWFLAALWLAFTGLLLLINGLLMRAYTTPEHSILGPYYVEGSIIAWIGIFMAAIGVFLYLIGRFPDYQPPEITQSSTSEEN